MKKAIKSLDYCFYSACSFAKEEKCSEFKFCDGISINLHDYVLNKLVEEQGGLCAYCMCRMPEIDRRTGKALRHTIEHIRPQSTTKNTSEWQMELRYSNFLAVCHGNQGSGGNLCCDKSRKDTLLFLNPLNESSIRRIAYSNSGEIMADDSAPNKDVINKGLNIVLNLNNGKDLKKKRQKALNGMKKALQKKGDDQNIDECKRKLLLLKNERNKKIEYVGILIYWLERHIWKLEKNL